MTREEQVAFVQHVNLEMAALLRDLEKSDPKPFVYREGRLRIVGTIVRRPEKQYPEAEVKFDLDHHEKTFRMIFSSEPCKLFTGSDNATLIVEWRLHIDCVQAA